MNLKDKKADYYSTVHATQVEKIAKPTDHFKNYVLALLADRHYEKVIETCPKFIRFLKKILLLHQALQPAIVLQGMALISLQLFTTLNQPPGSRAPLFLAHPMGLGPTPFPRGFPGALSVIMATGKGDEIISFVTIVVKNNHTENRCFSKQKDKK